jgi:hypothetical protein
MLLLAALVVILGVSVTLLAGGTKKSRPLPRSDGTQPSLALLTSLPLVFGERMTLTGGGSKVLDALERRYDVIPVATADPSNLRQAPILFMAHALAQPAQTLVGLDHWVRAGGKLLLLADPALEWESERPLGDPLRASPMFPDTGLLGHWGLRLDAPEERGPTPREIAGRRVLTNSPGELHGTCMITEDRLIADCRIGKGRAIIIADADFLEAGSSTQENLDALLLILAELERI